jgi:NTE family protein
MPDPDVQTVLSPVEAIPKPERLDEQGVALCLSGGGYRAMVFHVGALWRLNELGWLPKLTRVSSVSGGSITAAVLGWRWKHLQFDANGVAQNLRSEVIERVQSLAGHTIDWESILLGLLLPGSIADKVTNAYARHLFGDATLQDLPADGQGPRFVINASSVQTGALWRFSQPYMADYRVGMIRNPTVPLAVAVAASSAFPPVLSPLKLEINPASFDPAENGDLHEPPFTTEVVLTDGGVYDNLGLETAWKRCRTVLVSDGGGQMQPEAKPKTDWARHALRINGLIDNQVRALRKRQVVGSFEAKERTGAYWGIRSHVADYGLADALDCPPEKTLALANLQTRLKRLDRTTQERLINWGYAICDTGMRKWVLSGMSCPTTLPFPAVGLG